MPKWVVLRTTQGKSLVNEILSGTTNGPLKITRIIACRKGGMSTSKMLSATKEDILKEDRYAQDLKIIDLLNTSMTPPFNEEESLIVGQLRNDLVSEDIPTSIVDGPNYNSWQQGNQEWELHQIAIFAKTDNTNEILFMLAQDKEPDTIPIKNVEQGGNIIQINYTFNILNSEDLILKNAQLNTSGYVTAEMYTYINERLIKVENDYLSKSEGGDVVSDITSSNNSAIKGFKVESDSIKYKGVELEDTLNNASKYLSIHDKYGNVLDIDTDNIKATQTDNNYVDLELTQSSVNDRKLRIDRSKQADNANQFSGKFVSDFVSYNFCKNDDFNTKILSGLYTMTECLNSPSSVTSIYWGLVVTVGSRNNDIGTYIGQTAFSVGSSLDGGEDINNPVIYIRQGLNPFPIYDERAGLEYSSYTDWGEWIEVSLKGHIHSKSDIEGLVDKESGKITVDFSQYAWDANKLNGKLYENYVTNKVYHSVKDLNNPSFDKAYITVTTDTSIIPNTIDGSSGYWHLMHFPYSNGCSTQFAMPFGTNKVYTRSSKNNIWSDWVSLLTSEGGTILYDDEDVVKKVDLSDSGVCITNSNYSPSFVAYHDNEYGSFYKGNKINIADNEISVYEESRYNDENGDYENKITINSDTIKYEGDYNGYLRGFIVEGYERVRNVTTAVDWNTLNATGLYHIRTQEGTNRPITNHGLLYVDNTVGTPFQLFIPDGNTKGIYKRRLNSDTWINMVDDVVDGKIEAVLGDKRADDFVPYTTIVSNGDFNNLTEVGVYQVEFTTTNAPTADSKYYGVLVLKSADRWVEQIAVTPSGKLYTRAYAGSSWSDWSAIGSDGGNADTVDGKHASDLQNYNNLTNKPTSLKNPYSLTIKGNGTALTNGTYDGSATKTINITPSVIGAAPCSVRDSGDFNNMITPGIYTMRSTTANAPTTGSYYGLIVLESDDNNDGYIEQIVFKESSYEVYIRYCSSYDDEDAEYNWSTWKKLALAPIIQAESSTNITTIDSSLSNGDILMLYS